jgi:hypothetical protein
MATERDDRQTLTILNEEIKQLAGSPHDTARISEISRSVSELYAKYVVVHHVQSPTLNAASDFLHRLVRYQEPTQNERELYLKAAAQALDLFLTL